MNKEQLLRNAIEKYEGEIMTLQVMVMGLKTELALGRYSQNQRGDDDKNKKYPLPLQSSAELGLSDSDTHTKDYGHKDLIDKDYEAGFCKKCGCLSPELKSNLCKRCVKEKENGNGGKDE